MRKLLLILLITNSLYAQEDDFGSSDVAEVKIEEAEKSDWKSNLLRKNLSGSIGHSSIFGRNSEYRGYSHLRLRYEKNLPTNTKIAAEALYDYTQIKFIQVPEDRSRTDLEPEKKLNYRKTELRAEEAYIEQEIFDNLSISYGIQKVVWGQFEPFSPTNLAFPFNLSTTDVEFSKVKGTLAQETGIIRYFPSSNISLSLYAFPKLTYDPIIQKIIDNPGRYYDGQNIVDGIFVMPEKSDRLQTGVRLMYYPSWGTMGFTYYKGFNTSTPHTSGNIRLSGTRGIKSQITTFSREEMFGFELALPRGSWTHKIEYSMTKTTDPIDINDSLSDITILSPASQEYLNGILNLNNGSLLIPATLDILAVGTTGNLRRWYFNLMVFYFDYRYDEVGKRLKELKENSQESDDGYDGPVFPGLVISRYLNDSKTSELGLAASIISNGQGVALFYKRTSDSWVQGLALQNISYFSDNSIAESGGDRGYERRDSNTTGILVSITRKF